MIFLETQRLYLRSLRTSDIEELYDYRNEERCARFQRGQLRERADLEALILRRQNDAFLTEGKKQLAIGFKDGTLIGEITIFNQAAIVMGYTLSYKHHRKGYAYEMLSAVIVALHQAYPTKEFLCFVEFENVASIRLLKKLGYEALGVDSAENALVFGKYSKAQTIEKYRER